jgi:hypothetical protein
VMKALCRVRRFFSLVEIGEGPKYSLGIITDDRDDLMSVLYRDLCEMLGHLSTSSEYDILHLGYHVVCPDCTDGERDEGVVMW